MIIGPYTILKNEKWERSSVFAFFSMVWGDRFIITPSEIQGEKVPFYSAVVIPEYRTPKNRKMKNTEYRIQNTVRVY